MFSLVSPSSDVESHYECYLHKIGTVSTTHKSTGFWKHQGLAIITEVFVLWSDSCPSQQMTIIFFPYGLPRFMKF